MAQNGQKKGCHAFSGSRIGQKPRHCNFVGLCMEKSANITASMGQEDSKSEWLFGHKSTFTKSSDVILIEMPAW